MVESGWSSRGDGEKVFVSHRLASIKDHRGGPRPWDESEKRRLSRDQETTAVFIKMRFRFAEETTRSLNNVGDGNTKSETENDVFSEPRRHRTAFIDGVSRPEHVPFVRKR